MDYFYCPPKDITGSSVLIEGDEFAHLVHVMRKDEGDHIRVVDGRGTAYDVQLGEIKKKTASGTILKTYQNFHEPSLRITVAVGILKNPSKFDFLVEKVTELGAAEIIPLKTGRTIPDHAKTDRWQKLALAAMKQCGRAYLPQVTELISLNELFKRDARYDLMMLAHEESSEPPRFDETASSNVRSLLILIGPEGGFSDEEVSFCCAAGCRTFSLGERRLRTETAAVAAAALSLLCQGVT